MNRGDVYRFNLDPTVGSEMQKTRLCVVVQRLSTERSPV
ncbi:MAG: type II toxin-antitoxin system PemK/MazF family toxin, partial [Candidatus Eremiobacteraeota bacterium]|nr:type II toxin-antitoxin system PemK/MazF family toxin [Candidatus Eremiobacteraeota bacterium]